MSATSDMYGINQLEPSIGLLDEVGSVTTQDYNIFDNIKVDEPEPVFDDKAEENYLLPTEGCDDDKEWISKLFSPEQVVPPGYINKYNEAQKVLKQKDREKLNYESISTSEDAQV